MTQQTIIEITALLIHQDGHERKKNKTLNMMKKKLQAISIYWLNQQLREHKHSFIDAAMRILLFSLV